MKLMEATLSKDTVALIEKLKSIVDKKGIIKDEVVELLTELRPHFIEQNEPLITRVIRLTAEYIDDRGTFDINLLQKKMKTEKSMKKSTWILTTALTK